MTGATQAGLEPLSFPRETSVLTTEPLSFHAVEIHRPGITLSVTEIGDTVELEENTDFASPVGSVS